MRHFASSFGSVELTDERLRHIITFHPEVKLYVKFFKDTLSKSDTVRQSNTDPQVKIYYKSLRRQSKFLAIVVKTNHRNFILTAYITTKIQHKPT